MARAGPDAPELKFRIHLPPADDASLVPRDRFLATDKFMSGDEIFVFVGCFVYGTTETPHHSSFCFFYDHKVSDIHSLPYCLTGQRAD